MPPSAAEGSPATDPPGPKNKDDNGAAGFSDDAMSTLGAALAGVRVGLDDGAFGNRVGQGLENSTANTFSGVGTGWASGPTANADGTMNNSPRFARGNGNGVLNTCTGLLSVPNASDSFPEQLPSLMAAKGSALKQQLESSSQSGAAAPATPPVRKKIVNSFQPRSPSQARSSNQAYPSSGGFEHETERRMNESNSIYPPGFGMTQAHVRRNSSPSVSVIGTSASSRSSSPLPARGYSGVVPPAGVHQAGGEFSDRGGLGKRTTSTNSLRSLEGNLQNQWSYGVQPSQFSSDASQFRYSSGKSPPNLHGLSMNQADPRQQAPPQSGEQTYHQTQAQQQQQVLYMAVQTPDGRQVLQPVQMVQLSGQAPAVVMPAAAGQGLVAFGNAGQGQPVVFMPAAQSTTSGMPIDSGVPRKQGIRRHNGYNHQGTRRGGRQTQYDNSDHLVSGRSQAYGDDRQAQHLSPNLMPTLSHGGSNPNSRRSTPSNSQRSSPRESPTPNDFIASLYASPQRPPLDNLLGHVRRLSRDQVGCRLLQQALDEEGPMAATMILNEGLSFWGEAMIDPFGNYLFQKIAEKVSFDERVILVRSVSARLVNASLNLHGTRSVQKVVELCAADEVKLARNGCRPPETAGDILTRSLTSAAARLCIDSHGNHVIQRILLKLPYQQSQFVFEAVAASVGDVARHRHGCCVIQRCLDSPPSDARSLLVHRIVDKALELMQDAYGNYVVQYVLDVCGDEDVHAVCESVVGKASLLAIQKFSSNVMEKCLERCTDRVREHYLNELSDQDKIRELMMDPFGNYVIQRALSVATHSQAIRLVEAMKPHLLSSPQGSTGPSCGGIRNTAGGRRIMAKICRRFPNFTLMEDCPSAEHSIYQPVRPTAHRNSHRQHQRQMVPSMSPHQSPAKQGGVHDRNRVHPQYHGAHGHGNVAGPVPAYPMQMGNSRMMYPHSM